MHQSFFDINSQFLTFWPLEVYVTCLHEKWSLDSPIWIIKGLKCISMLLQQMCVPLNWISVLCLLCLDVEPEAHRVKSWVTYYCTTHWGRSPAVQLKVDKRLMADSWESVIWANKWSDSSILWGCVLSRLGRWPPSIYAPQSSKQLIYFIPPHPRDSCWSETPQTASPPRPRITFQGPSACLIRGPVVSAAVIVLEPFLPAQPLAP